MKRMVAKEIQESLGRLRYAQTPADLVAALAVDIPGWLSTLSWRAPYTASLLQKVQTLVSGFHRHQFTRDPARTVRFTCEKLNEISHRLMDTWAEHEELRDEMKEYAKQEKKLGKLEVLSVAPMMGTASGYVPPPTSMSYPHPPGFSSLPPMSYASPYGQQPMQSQVGFHQPSGGYGMGMQGEPSRASRMDTSAGMGMRHGAPGPRPVSHPRASREPRNPMHRVNALKRAIQHLAAVRLLPPNACFGCGFMGKTTATDHYVRDCPVFDEACDLAVRRGLMEKLV